MLRQRRPAPKLTPKNKEVNKELIDNSELIETNNLVKEVLDLNSFKPSESRGINKCIAQAGVISIVNAKTGKRIIISKEIMERLNNPEKIVMSFTEGKIAIGKQLPNNENYLNIKLSKSKGIIYSAGIVKEITDKYQLDLSSRTSITFSEVEYTNYDEYVVAVVKVD